MISGASHVPPDAMHIRDEMDDFFRWFRQHESHMHPVAFAAEAHLRLVSIHPFIDGNGRTSRLLMNLHLMRHGYPLCIIRGETHSRLSYYQHLDDARTGESTQPFVFFIADILLENSRRLATLLGASN
jgi:Fic family protein